MRLRSVVRIFLVGVGLLLVVLGGTALWASRVAEARLSAVYETHRVDLPVPFDPTGQDAVARGKHLVEARYACIECHGKDFGGGTMIDGMPVARLFGPNLTGGEGSVVRNYEVADWDRAVRHGVLADGRPSVMPSEDYFAMSDEELSDIIAYIQSVPPVDRPSRPRELGPVGVLLMALKEIRLSAEHLSDHRAAHAVRPPEAAETVEFGKHLMNPCIGCHRPSLNGGPIAGGDPSWPPAKNITAHADGIAGWTYEDFVAAMREGRSKDGTPFRAPMIQMVPYAKNMKDLELKAMWKFLQTVEPMPTGD